MTNEVGYLKNVLVFIQYIRHIQREYDAMVSKNVNSYCIFNL